MYTTGVFAPDGGPQCRTKASFASGAVATTGTLMSVTVPGAARRGAVGTLPTCILHANKLTSFIRCSSIVRLVRPCVVSSHAERYILPRCSLLRHTNVIVLEKPHQATTASKRKTISPDGAEYVVVRAKTIPTSPLRSFLILYVLVDIPSNWLLIIVGGGRYLSHPRNSPGHRRDLHGRSEEL